MYLYTINVLRNIRIPGIYSTAYHDSSRFYESQWRTIRIIETLFYFIKLRFLQDNNPTFSICKIITTFYTPPPIVRSIETYFFRVSILAQRLFGRREMIAEPMTRFDSTPRKIDGGTFFRNPARAATSASGSLAPGNDDLRVSFVFCNWHAEPDGEHER